MGRSTLSKLVLALSVWSNGVAGIDLDLTSDDNIKSVAKTIVADMVQYYSSTPGVIISNIPGQLPGPPANPTITNAGYFWWEGGAMFGALIDYWYYTGDTTYNDMTSQALQHQSGPNHDYLPQNQTLGMGNDDQGFWAMSAMTAAELGFPNPPEGSPQWLALVQAVYNIQVPKIDQVCGGGLRWQAYTFLNGYKYKNSISNGCLFNMAARLALYTGNSSYADQAEKTWEWMEGVGFIDAKHNVYDGAGVDNNCTEIYKAQFSYNAGIFLHGAAAMYKFTGSDVWRTRLQTLLTQTVAIFFPDGIAYEVACEKALIHCSIDMLSYKAYLTRWMAASTKWAPFITDTVMPLLATSAAAAAKQCSGSPADRPNGRMCGLSWSKGEAWDGTSGIGQEMAALQVIQGNLIKGAKDPLTNATGGTSKGDPAAGTGDPTSLDPTLLKPLTTGDKAGAGILTAIVVAVILSGLIWVSLPDGNMNWRGK
ncbi:related to DFG5 protein [Rhynchosporium agropyri]|uniref:Mannan endo-1,6-alpha-mannosidase n=1 Tax=Rhynchosporium agropyri TaxID=914238 RepID=A0A1E1K9N6_9HELO|nr:related to DFG5 protein [Rhynchosporium agropyri]